MKRFFLFSILIATALVFSGDAFGQSFLNKVKKKAKEIQQTVEQVSNTVNSTSRTTTKQTNNKRTSGDNTAVSNSTNDGIYIPPKLHSDIPYGNLVIDEDSIICHVTEKTKQYSLKSNYYPEIRDYHNGMTIVKSDGEFFFMDNTGNKITPEKPVLFNNFEQKDKPEQFENGHVIVKFKSGGYGIMDKGGKIVKNFQADIEDAAGFCDGVGVLLIRNSSKRSVNDPRRYKWQYIDTDGNNIWPELSIPTTATGAKLRHLKCGLRAVCKYDPAEKKSKWGFVDEKGNFKIAPLYAEVRDFSDGIAAVREFQPNSVLQTGRWAFIDKQGNQITDFIFSQTPSDFNAGKAVVKTRDGSKQVVINNKGEILFTVPNVYDLSSFSPDGYAIYWGSTDDSKGFSRRVAYCIKDNLENKLSYAERDTEDFIFSPEDNMFYVRIGYPTIYVPVDIPSMNSLPTKAIRPFSEGLGVAENGVVDLDGNYIVIFVPNVF